MSLSIFQGDEFYWNKGGRNFFNNNEEVYVDIFWSKEPETVFVTKGNSLKLADRKMRLDLPNILPIIGFFFWKIDYE